MDVLNSYIYFCVETVVSTKTVKCYPNGKQWVTKDLRSLLKEKNQCLADGNWIELQLIPIKVDSLLSLCKTCLKVTQNQHGMAYVR